MKTYNSILFWGLILMFCHCNSAEHQNYPNTEFQENDKTITDSENFLAKKSDLSSKVFEYGLKLKSLSDLDALEGSSSALLLFRNGVVFRISKNGNTKKIINSQGRGPGEFKFATNLKIRNGYIFILDQTLSKISKFTLNGKHLRDISFKLGWARSFEVLKNGNIVIMNFSQHMQDAQLLIVYNQEGKIVDDWGNNTIIQPILKEVDQIPAFLINKSYDNQLIITSILTGESFIFDITRKKISGQFTIQNGPEWEAMVDFENKSNQNTSSKGYFRKVENIDFFSNDDILISWGGPFEDSRSISMIYDENGFFLNRVFKNENIQYRPTLFSIEDDTTLWIYRRGSRILTRTFLKLN